MTFFVDRSLKCYWIDGMNNWQSDKWSFKWHSLLGHWNGIDGMNNWQSDKWSFKWHSLLIGHWNVIG
jgi:hypothetical protein